MISKFEDVFDKKDDIKEDVILETPDLPPVPELPNVFDDDGKGGELPEFIDLPTEEGKTELVERIQEIISCDFEIITHFAGVRPTVRDRRPLVGTHAIHNRIHVLNGLGTRGVMLGPAMAKALYDAIENKIPLHKEIDIQRFKNKKK